MKEKLVKTILILELDIGKFPTTMNKLKDFEEYLEQSDHLLNETKITGIKQG